ncbi:MAG: polyisoprenoid-binding protein [Deltaproteobacteria bacterium]|nr:polyisoprenoid-binding protein [Deltaproteobacteria bacterium]
MRSLLRILALGAACVFFAAPALGGEPDARPWELDAEHSSIGFRVKHVSGYVTGFFSRFSGDIEFDPARPEDGRFYILVDSSSVTTGTPARDAHLRGADFLDVARFPRIMFASKAVIREDGDAYVALGDLTIRDVTCEVRVPLTFLGSRPHPLRDRLPGVEVMGLQAKLVVNRLEFQVGSGPWADLGVIGDSIELNMDMELMRHPR